MHFHPLRDVTTSFHQLQAPFLSFPTSLRAGSLSVPVSQAAVVIRSSLPATFLLDLGIAASNLAEPGVGADFLVEGYFRTTSINLFCFYFSFYVFTREIYDKNLCFNVSKQALSNV